MTDHRKVQTVGMARLAWAALLLVAPAQTIRVLGGEPDERSVRVARILGVRHAGQGLIETVGRNDPRRLQASVDLAHAISAIVVGAADRRRRKPAFADAAIAFTWAALGLRLGRPRLDGPGIRHGKSWPSRGGQARRDNHQMGEST